MSDVLRHCHLCGESEVFGDIETCVSCSQWVCAECSADAETDAGDPLGVVCFDCIENAE